MSDTKVMVCWKVADLPNPKAGATRGHYCADCNAELWAMPKNAALGMRMLCQSCCIIGAIGRDDVVMLPASEAHKNGPGAT